MLRVWLPLTKDLRNQGLSNVTVTNNGATFNSAGKLGGCYTFGSGKYMRATPTSSLMQAKAVSVACWVKIISWNSSYDCLMSWADGTGWTNSRVTLARNNTNSNLRFTIADGTNYVGVNCTTTLALNTWYHVVGTYDGSNIKIYINGNLEGTAASTLSIVYAGTFNIGGWSGNNYPINGSLNDIRLYNHCLSPMEVKELSKGLVLHYPLNRQGWGQENLVTNSSSEWSSWVTPTVNGTNQCSNPGVAVLPDDKVSTDKFACQVEIEFSGVTIGTGGTCAFRAQGAVDGGWSNGTNPWTKILFSGTVPSDGVYKYTWIGSLNDTSVTHTNFNCGFRADYWGSGKYRVRCIKVEKGSIITPWCPHGNQTIYTTLGLNGTTEYDCSGFGNNGIKVGTLGWSSNTPKYNVSLDITTDSCARYIYGPAQTQLTNQITLACWLYQTSATATSGGNSTTNQFALSQGRDYLNLGFNITVNNGKPGVYAGNGGSESGARVSLISTTKTITGSWHHVAATYNNGALKLYVDGQLDRETTIGALDYVDAPALVIGKMAYGYTNATSYFPFVGYISDARVYATALSADDVKSLYQNSAYIDSSGNVYGAVHSEV